MEGEELIPGVEGEELIPMHCPHTCVHQNGCGSSNRICMVYSF